MVSACEQIAKSHLEAAKIYEIKKMRHLHNCYLMFRGPSVIINVCKNQTNIFKENQNTATPTGKKSAKQTILVNTVRSESLSPSSQFVTRM
jgi:hypothetical protein